MREGLKPIQQVDNPEPKLDSTLMPYGRIKYLEDSLNKAETNCEASRAAVGKASERLAEQAKLWADTNKQGEDRYQVELDAERRSHKEERDRLVESHDALKKEVADMREAHAKQIAALEEGIKSQFN